MQSSGKRKYGRTDSRWSDKGNTNEHAIEQERKHFLQSDDRPMTDLEQAHFQIRNDASRRPRFPIA
jgi:hypothetical protein